MSFRSTFYHTPCQHHCEIQSLFQVKPLATKTSLLIMRPVTGLHDMKRPAPVRSRPSFASLLRNLDYGCATAWPRALVESELTEPEPYLRTWAYPVTTLEQGADVHDTACLGWSEAVFPAEYLMCLLLPTFHDPWAV